MPHDDDVSMAEQPSRDLIQTELNDKLMQLGIKANAGGLSNSKYAAILDKLATERQQHGEVHRNSMIYYFL